MRTNAATARYLSYALLLLVIALFGVIRFRLRNMPLERDEGEYAYMGQLMLQGIPPYKLAYTMKLPGTAAAYAIILALFGQTAAGIHIGLLLMNAATSLLVYILAARLSGRLAGFVAGASYALLSTSFSVLGFAAHATHFVVFFALAGILVLLKAIETRRSSHLFASGVLLGLAFLMKQPGIVFAVFGGLYLLCSEWPPPIRWRSLMSRVGWYVAGVILPFGLTCLILLYAGVFRTFWFWVFTYARAYGSETSVSVGALRFAEIFPAIVAPSIGVWIMAALGLTALLWDREIRAHASFMSGFLLFSFLAVCPGFFFREHYFILMLPAVALLSGTAVESVTQGLARAGRGIVLRAIPLLLFAVVAGFSVFQQRVFLFERDPILATQKLYGPNPFPEAVEIARYIDDHSSASDRIAVFGSEPEIYFYAKRHSATGFIYVYGLMEQQKYAFEMQRQMIDEIRSAQPQFVVAVNTRVSWLAQEGSPQALAFTAWADNYLGSHYQLVGVADRVGDHTEYRWGDEAKTYPPRSRNVIGIFKRKG
ncbi:MAG: glycosyltransferase family 39 protein [Terriglobales bacterium]